MPPAVASVPALELSEERPAPETPVPETPTPETLPYPTKWAPPIATAKGGVGNLVLAAKHAPAIVIATAKHSGQPQPAPPVLLPATQEPNRSSALVLAESPDPRPWLAKGPEVSLEKDPKFGKDAKEAKDNIAKLAKIIAEENKKKTDGFIHHVKANRPDLAGLPFQLSPGCQLDKDQAQLLETSSRTIRAHLDRPQKHSHSYDAGIYFWNSLQSQSSGSRAFLSTRALVQILEPESAGYRHGLLRTLHANEGAEAARHLARLALFDPDTASRQMALEGLLHRPKDDYAKVLLEGLRYPWSPVVRRAAEAVTLLKCDHLVPKMIDLLDGPEPAAPSTKESNGQKSLVVREVVKINHHRNCLLCHAPSESRSDLVRAPVPNPYEKLPPSAAIYYSKGNEGSTMVRADVTYLRQDFSLCLEVDKADPWPKMQRFDFAVRERPATAEEKVPVGPTEYHQIIAHALRTLTGMDAGIDAASWRMALAGTTNRLWKSVCMK
jgi:hypothetical protein